MARKLRLEYPGALYHIINGDNERCWIFDAASTRAPTGTSRTIARYRGSYRGSYRSDPDWKTLDAIAST